MTWVIGATTHFGYAVLMSDVCVTFGDDTTRDLVQKAFPVGDFVAAGFAGSVPIGFQMLDDLRDFLRLNDDEQGCCWEPEWIAENWPPRAKAVFEKAPPRWQQGRSHILMVGVSPNESVLGGAVPFAIAFKSPEFVPEVRTSGNQPMSIGSGESVKVYKDQLQYLCADESLTPQVSEVNSPGGFGRLIASSLSRTAFHNPVAGISNHMHIIVVALGKIEVLANNQIIYPSDGDPLSIEMPPVATSLIQLEDLLGVGVIDAITAT